MFSAMASENNFIGKKRKRILFLTFYFPPDLCAGSFRSSALIEQLRKQNFEIDVITTQPNRYKELLTKVASSERIDNVQIERIKITQHDSGLLDQIISFYDFYKKTIKVTKNKDYDLIFATTSRLFTGYLAARISNRTKTVLYLDVRDLFSDTIKDIFKSKLFKPLHHIILKIEKYTFESAEKINIVSPGFSTYFTKRYSNKKISHFTNGIDDIFLQFFKNTEQSVENKIKKKLTILYAGNIGSGQNLHQIIPDLSKNLAGNAEFRIIGGGGMKKKLIEAIKAQGCVNVEVIDPIPQDQLLFEYLKADILFLNLGKQAAFEKVIPSKIFEYAATGKPILAGLSGVSARFAKSEIENCAIFHPSNPESAIIELRKLQLENYSRERFNNKYSRKTIMKDMARDIADCINEE